MKEKSNWRSTTTEPPPLDTYILIKTKTGLVRVARRHIYPNNQEAYEYSSVDFKCVIWWQPLPK